MIIYSTPSSITWQHDVDHRLTFLGEWTLEPKFYLSVPAVSYWDGTEKQIALTPQELQDALMSLQVDATSKGWFIAFDPPFVQK